MDSTRLEVKVKPNARRNALVAKHFGCPRRAVVFAFLPQLKELRKVRPMSRSGLIFRVTRIQPLSGMVFEVVGRFRRKP